VFKKKEDRRQIETSTMQEAPVFGCCGISQAKGMVIYHLPFIQGVLFFVANVSIKKIGGSDLNL
jgi:hypothetical protein